MADLINDLLTYSDISMSAWTPAPVSTEEVLSETLQLLRHAIEESNARVTHDPLPVVTADRSQLTRLFQNLISNAVKFSPSGGDVGVTVDRVEDDAVLAVRDHGVGIPPEDRGAIFERFRRGTNVKGIPGTGIGLTLAKEIVEADGGRIFVESVPGKGSVFTVRLPLSGESAT